MTSRSSWNGPNESERAGVAFALACRPQNEWMNFLWWAKRNTEHLVIVVLKKKNSELKQFPNILNCFCVMIVVSSCICKIAFRQWLKILFRRQRLDRSVDLCCVPPGDFDEQFAKVETDCSVCVSWKVLPITSYYLNYNTSDSSWMPLYLMWKSLKPLQSWFVLGHAHVFCNQRLHTVSFVLLL